MKRKKILVGILAIVVLLGATYVYFWYRQITLSPPGKEMLTSSGLSVSITYSRPSVRNRIIFGTEDQKALQPYGKYWRLGANNATEITFNRDILFNEIPVKAGTYRMYAFPGAESFEIALNSELGKWGYSEPDYDFDVLRTKVPVERIALPVEQFSVSLTPAEGGMNIVFEWSVVRLVVPLKVQ